MTGPSPFHAGEQLVQERAGVRAKAEALGRRMIQASMPAQHQEFYAQLPLLFFASLDGEGRPWASVLAGQPGFARPLGPDRLKIGAAPPAFDPGLFQEGSLVGMLGLEFETRRRNRMNGRIVSVHDPGFTVEVHQAFGNCPNYIQTRKPRPHRQRPRLLAQGSRLEHSMASLIEASDTFMIASVNPGEGLDLSHRGGRPGFVKVVDEHTLLWPDFVGNNQFNTLGNIALDPRSGYLFFDLSRGLLLYLTGRSQIHWEHPEMGTVDGAQRLLSFTVDEARLVADSLALGWKLESYSRGLARTGTFAPNDP
ncbi:MAG: pyridoxamine 5'-phosphate oxidase family protein [Candidatus Eremiobacteraeota bacterium]|nr:pyridoxamine 5'-phosphate oxidase family protein [Candidatus Eremiobacteraeota bacterium]